jgi:hypothetical protein
MSNFLRSLFGSKKSNPKIKPRMQSRRLELIGLEERITPAATITNVNGILTISLAAGDTITNLNALYNSSNDLVINTVGNANIATGLPTGVAVSSSSGTLNDVITVTDTTFVNGILGISVVGSTGIESVTVGGAINLSTNNLSATNSLSIGTTLETLNVNAAITTLGATPGISGASLAATAVTIGAAGIINTTTGNVGISGVISTAGNVITTTGLTTYTGAVTLTGNVAIGNGSTTTGGVNFTSTVNGLFGITTTASGAAPVTFGGIVGGTTPVGALAIASTGTISFGAAVNAASIAQTLAGAVTLGGAVNTTGAISFAGTVDGASSSSVISVTSTNDSIAFESTVGATSANANGITINAITPTKTISLGGNVSAANNSNIAFNGDVLVTKSASALAVTSQGNGNISFSSKVDASVSGNDLTLTAGSGVVTLTGNVGSANAFFGTLTASGTGTFLAAGTVAAGSIKLDQSNKFATSITFAKAVTVSDSPGGLEVNADGSGTVTFSDTITALGATSNNTDIEIKSVNGVINVGGAITGLDKVAIISSGSGSITLIGNVTTSGTSTTQDNGNIIIQSTTGNIVTSGSISTSGANANIEIDTATSGNVTIGGNVSTSGGGDILLGADFGGVATGAGNVTINGTVTTTGTTAGDILIGISGGTATVNKAVTAGPTGDVVFITNLLTDAITVVSGATITAGDSVGDFGSGILNLGANITAGTTGVAATLGIFINDVSVNLTGPVSLNSIGTGGGAGIFLDNVNGAQNLTLESTDQILLGSVGQAIALNTVTVTNSGGVTAGAFTAANVVLTDTTGTIAFGGTTVITNSLTTAAKAYDVTFAGTSVLSGAPVFLNTGNVTFGSVASDITSLTTGATITGSATSTVDLGGTIVSGGAFNIGALPATTTVANATQLILNSTTAASNFAGKVVSAGTGANALSLLGVGTLTLSGDSSSSGVTGDINVINGTLNVTGKLGSANVTSATSGTITGAGGTIGALTVNTGTVAPGGTLNTGAVTLNAATNYSAAVLTTTTAANLKTASAINLGGATLSLSSVAAGLAVNNTFTIIDNTAVSGLVTGTFANQPEGSSISAKDTAGNTVTFTVSYIGGTNANDVTLKVSSITPSTPTPTAPAQPMVAGQPALNKFTAVGADAGGGPLVTITFQNGTFVSFFAYASTFTGGVRVALGDVNGDGSTDVITGAGPGGGPQVNVYNVNNATGAVSLQKSFFAFNAPSFTGGVYVAAGNTNGDAFADVIVGAGATGGSRVQVYAGSATGVVTTSTLNDFFAYSPAFTGGVVVAAGQRDAVAGDEIITAPASGGGYNIKSFNANGTGNNPTVVDNFFAFNNTTSVGGLSLAVGLLNSGSIADLIVGTTNGGYGVIVDSATAGIAGVPFAGFTGAIRAGVAEDANGQDFAVALAGPTGAPRISVFSVGATALTQTDSLFVMNTGFTGGLFGTPTLPATIVVA